MTTNLRNHPARPITTLVVGNGMVSHRFCQKMLEYDLSKLHRLVVVGEEPVPAYDRVNLTAQFSEPSGDGLWLDDPEWYAQNGIELHLGTRIERLDVRQRFAVTSKGEPLLYDVLILATGSASFVPPIPGIEMRGVFVYRTIDDLDRIRAYVPGRRLAAVAGGGLLGLEAARALVGAGLETHVVEVETRLMPRQLDSTGSALLERTIRNLGLHVHLADRIGRVLGDGAVTGLELSYGRTLKVELLVVCAGIRARDELGRDAGLRVGNQGGVVVDDRLCSSASGVFAIGEVALHRGGSYGLVGPGYEMADVVARNLTGGDAAFEGFESSTRLKLMGTNVASIGDPFQDPAHSRTICFEDQVRGIYKKLVVTDDGRRLLGAILVGDTSSYGELLHLTRSRTELSDDLAQLGIGSAAPGAGQTADDVVVCSCNGVSAGTIRRRVRDDGLTSLAQIKACTSAGTGCGGCLPMVADVLELELKAGGRGVKPALCEHFALTREDLFEIVAATRIRTFPELLGRHGKGQGCEVCKPTVANIFASIHNEPVLDEPHRSLQDTNDRFLANIQKNGTYSVVPRVPGGEITGPQLIVLGQVAVKYGLYAKLTGGQRVDLLGARLEQLPQIWEDLVAAGFESGQAYGKSMRTVKSCVGSTWCRFGVQDSTAFAIRLEHRYKGIRSPHKMKSAVSGCIRECAEAQNKDFGLIATERGWNLFVCGNGGVSPRPADLLVSDIDGDTAVRYIDRFVMFYIRTAGRLTRTSVWLDKMDGGIERLRQVIVNDSLGIAESLEREMEALVGTYFCEWSNVLGDPAKRAAFSRFAAEVSSDDVAGPASALSTGESRANAPPYLESETLERAANRSWVRLATVGEVPLDGGIAARYGESEIALFHFASRGEWYATQNLCPHAEQMVLARGILGDHGGTPKVACPLHKNTFDLRTGRGLSNAALEIETFPVRVEGDGVWAHVPPPAQLARASCKTPCPPGHASPEQQTELAKRRLPVLADEGADGGLSASPAARARGQRAS